MSYEPDTLDGVVEFCAKEGQPTESLALLKAAAKAVCTAPYPLDAHPAFHAAMRTLMRALDG